MIVISKESPNIGIKDDGKKPPRLMAGVRHHKEGVMPSHSCPSTSKPKGERIMEDFLKFKKMFTPVIIQILFWIGVVGSVIMGIISIVGGASARYGGGGMVFVGFMLIIIGPIVSRVYCEILIVVFSINDTLTEMKNLLKGKTTI